MLTEDSRVARNVGSALSRVDAVLRGPSWSREPCCPRRVAVLAFSPFTKARCASSTATGWTSIPRSLPRIGMPVGGNGSRSTATGNRAIASSTLGVAIASWIRAIPTRRTWIWKATKIEERGASICRRLGQSTFTLLRRQWPRPPKKPGRPRPATTVSQNVGRRASRASPTARSRHPPTPTL